jgi:hypothetical protein
MAGVQRVTVLRGHIWLVAPDRTVANEHETRWVAPFREAARRRAKGLSTHHGCPRAAGERH